MSGFFVAVQRLVRRWHVHWMRFHHRTGANIYTQCRCGKRGWYPMSGGYSALDRQWLDAPNAAGQGRREATYPEPACSQGGCQ